MSDEINGELAPLGISELADRIREAIGAGPFECVKVYAPPHQSRGDGKEVTYMPLTMDEFTALRAMSRERLLAIGLRPWDDAGLMLFPVDWYPLIPAGFEVTSISGETEAFVPGETDNDCRYGVLAYGIMCPHG